MSKAPMRWREMERKVREIEAHATRILAMDRVPRPAKDAAALILALAAEILRTS